MRVRYAWAKTNLDQFRYRTGGNAVAPRGLFERGSMPAISREDRAPAPQSRWRKNWSAFRWGPIPRAPAVFRRHSTISSGLKPSGGLLSAAGVVPACRSLDCVSIFCGDV